MNSNAALPTGQLNAPSTVITDLNADCLHTIFRLLDLEDLVMASDACSRFRESASETFKYDWKRERIELSNQCRDDQLEATAILRNFGSQLQKVFIHFGERKNLEFINMFMEKCNGSQLTELNLSGTTLSTADVCRLKNKFTNLKSLGFEITMEQTPDSIEMECVEQHFPTLDQLRLFGHPLLNRNFERIISLNPQLKSLCLLYWSDVWSRGELLQLIDYYLPQLEELELQGMEFIGMDDDRPDTDVFKPTFLRNLKRLTLKFFLNGKAMQHCSLISNEKVEELVLVMGYCDEDAVDFICQYKEVKKLTILEADYEFDYKLLLKLCQHLPKLTELEISISICCVRVINQQDIIELLSGCKNLVKFAIENNKSEDTLADVNHLMGRLDSSKWSVDCNPSEKQTTFNKKSYF